MSAMRQNDNYQVNFTNIYSSDLRETLKKAYIVNDADRIGALTDSSNRNPVKLREKKRHLNNLCAERSDILQDAELLDAALNSNMKDTLNRLLPLQSSHVNKLDNDGSARSLVSLKEPLQVFLSKYKEQKKINNETMRSTRGTVQEPLHIQFIQQIIDIFKQVDARVVGDNAGKMIKQFTPLSLSRMQRERTFSQERHDLVDGRYRNCLFCLHPSMNSVPENDTAMSDNERTIAEHEAASKVYNEYKKRQEAEDRKANGRKLPKPVNPNTNKVMNQAPKQATLKEIILMCMCQNSQCMMEKSDISSTCFMLCYDVGKNMRCPWDPITGECTCEVCKCQCPAAYNLSDAGSIALGLQQLQQAGHFSANADVTPNDGGAGELRQFMVRMANGGLLSAANATANNSNVDVEQTQSLVMEHTASTIARNAGLLPASARQALQRQFGNSTEVTLPNGNTINTRQLGAQRMNLHTNNNRLGTSTSTVGNYLPGMRDHQRPDFSNPTQEFLAASRQPSAGDSFLAPLFAAAATGAGASMPSSSIAAASAPAATSTGTQDNSQQMLSDEAYARQLEQQLQTGESQQVMSDEALARELEQQQQRQRYASMENGGGKMGPTATGEQEAIYVDDGLTPSPPTMTNRPSAVSTLSSGAVSSRGRTGRAPSVARASASSLFSPFDASSSTVNKNRTAEQRIEARNNNALETLQNLENYNNAQMTSWKSKKERDEKEKKQRKQARKRKEVVIEPLHNLKATNPVAFTNLLSSVVAPGEQTLSQTPLKASPDTAFNRLANALESDDSSSSDEEECS